MLRSCSGGSCGYPRMSPCIAADCTQPFRVAYKSVHWFPGLYLHVQRTDVYLRYRPGNQRNKSDQGHLVTFFLIVKKYHKQYFNTNLCFIVKYKILNFQMLFCTCQLGGQNAYKFDCGTIDMNVISHLTCKVIYYEDANTCFENIY